MKGIANAQTLKRSLAQSCLYWSRNFHNKMQQSINLLFTDKNMLLKVDRNAAFCPGCSAYSIMNNIGPSITLKDG